MINLTFGLFTQMSDSGPHGPLVFLNITISKELLIFIFIAITLHLASALTVASGSASPLRLRFSEAQIYQTVT